MAEDYYQHKIKKYKGNRKLEDICKAMKEKGMEVDCTEFDNGSDYVCFKGPWDGMPLSIILNTFNGQFSVFNGFTSALLATHLSTELDYVPWYMDLLDTLYEPLEN